MTSRVFGGAGAVWEQALEERGPRFTVGRYAVSFGQVGRELDDVAGRSSRALQDPLDVAEGLHGLNAHVTFAEEIPVVVERHLPAEVQYLGGLGPGKV